MDENEEIDINEVESYVNMTIVVRLNPEQYSFLVACMTDWVETHPDESEAIAALKSIEFVRDR